MPPIAARAAEAARRLHPEADDLLVYVEDEASATVIVRVAWVLRKVEYTDLDRVSGPSGTLSPSR